MSIYDTLPFDYTSHETQSYFCISQGLLPSFLPWATTRRYRHPILRNLLYHDSSSTTSSFLQTSCRYVEICDIDVCSITVQVCADGKAMVDSAILVNSRRTLFLSFGCAILASLTRVIRLQVEGYTSPLNFSSYKISLLSRSYNIKKWRVNHGKVQL